ncbi:hypothetical protein GCM10010420_17300 [Streptomyces glaucosporus]|uniref:DUF8017 domain-containing protein n=1 Tax=Streptomyces glaucosporus TaxID=284044 RepID=A0ABP5V2L7_9ACTN
MWPGQQQPGSGQNPQQPNPYQTPGYQAPNPYQQPGYQAPNPYQQPQPGGQWGQPGMPGAPQPPQNGGGGGKGGRTAAIAIVVAVAVIAAAVVAGVFVFRDDEAPAAKGGPTASPSAEPSTGESAPEETDRGDDPSNPRDGLVPEKPDPVIPGWKVVTNSKNHNAFDVPPEWQVDPSESTFISYGLQDKDDPFSGPQVAFTGPAYYKRGWCQADGGRYTRAVVGSKGGQGSRNTAEAAEIAADNFVYFAYGEQKKTVKRAKAEKFSNDHGIKGHIATATATGVKKNNKCESDGKVVAVSWIDGTNDLRIWLIVTDAGVKDEVPQSTIDKITSTLRPYAEED